MMVIRYLQHIHPTFPILARTKARVQSILSQSPIVLQQAFHEAFNLMLKTWIPSTDNVARDFNSVISLLKTWDRDSQIVSDVTDLIHLQALVMVVIEAGARDGATTQRRPTVPSLLWQAIGLGMSMELYKAEPDAVPGPEFDMDSDDNVAIRVWWTLVMLDRWHAIGTASRVLIPNDMVVMLPGLKFILGEVGYNLIRKWFLISPCPEYSARAHMAQN
jgi:hypothetical protein